MRSDPWVFAGCVLLVVAVAARSTALGTLGLLLLVVVAGAWLWSWYALHAVSYTRSLSSDRVYAEESVSLEISLTNAKPLALAWVLVEDRFDPHLRVRNLDSVDSTGREWELRHQVSVGPYQRLRWRYNVECPRRGYHRIGPASLHSGDPFGFYERERKLTATDAVLVYPRLLPLEELDLDSRFPFEGYKGATGSVLDPLNVVGARPYAETDTIRQVHWRASARSQGLQSRVLRPATEQSVVIFLDLASSIHPWEGINSEAVERAISAAATLAHRVHAARWGLGLHVNGLRSGTRQRIGIGPTRGDNALALVMDVLARVPPYPTLPFVQLLRLERRRIPTGATVVAVSALRTPELEQELQLYRRAGHGARLLDVRGREDPIAVPVIGEVQR